MEVLNASQVQTNNNLTPLRNSGSNDFDADAVGQTRVLDMERIRNACKQRQNQLKEWTNYDKRMSRDSDRALRKGYPSGTTNPTSTPERNLFSSASNRSAKGVQFPQSLILLEAAARGDLDEVRTLLSSGVCPDVANEDGLTALHQCCIDNNLAMCRLLLRFGANPNACDLEQWTPLHAAATCQNFEICAILIEKSANLLAMNVDGNMPYECCVLGEALTVIEEAMDRKGITQEQLDDLHRIPECRMLQDMETLYKNGQDLNQLDKQGAAPLHIAAACGFEEVTIFLLKHGAKINLHDKEGWEAVHIAACWGHVEIIEVLANYGANLMSETMQGETIFDVCEDPSMHGTFIQLRDEAERKRSQLQLDDDELLSPLDKSRGLVRRRSSTNPRSASIRRHSMRDKKAISRVEAKQEAELLGVSPDDAVRSVASRDAQRRSSGTWPNDKRFSPETFQETSLPLETTQDHRSSQKPSASRDEHPQRSSSKQRPSGEHPGNSTLPSKSPSSRSRQPHHNSHQSNQHESPKVNDHASSRRQPPQSPPVRGNDPEDIHSRPGRPTMNGVRSSSKQPPPKASLPPSPKQQYPPERKSTSSRTTPSKSNDTSLDVSAHNAYNSPPPPPRKSRTDQTRSQQPPGGTLYHGKPQTAVSRPGTSSRRFIDASDHDDTAEQKPSGKCCTIM